LKFTTIVLSLCVYPQSQGEIIPQVALNENCDRTGLTTEAHHRPDRTQTLLRGLLRHRAHQADQALLALDQASEAILRHATTLSIERLTIIMGYLDDARTVLQSAPDAGGAR
jgi:hypothetical protein